MNHPIFESDSNSKNIKVIIELKGRDRRDRMEVFYIPPEKAKQIYEDIYLNSNLFVSIDSGEELVLIRIDEIRLIAFSEIKKQERDV